MPLSLRESLLKHFRFGRGCDNLPILARPIDGRDRGRYALAGVLRDLGVQTAIEIGVGAGESIKIWKDASPNLDITGIDPYYDGRHYERALSRSKTLGFKLIKQASLDVVDDFDDESVDFVNIDGDHTFDYVVQDLVRWVPKVKKGGLVLVHDYCAFESAGVVKAVDAYTHCHHIDPWYVTRDCNPTAFWERGIEKI